MPPFTIEISILQKYDSAFIGHYRSHDNQHFLKLMANKASSILVRQFPLGHLVLESCLWRCPCFSLADASYVMTRRRGFFSPKAE